MEEQRTPDPYTPPSPPPFQQVPPQYPMQMHPGYAYGQMPPVTADDRSMAMICHLLAIFTGFLGPLVLWLVKKDQSHFIDHHGREALNFQVTLFLAYLVLFGITIVGMFVFIGFFLFPLFFVLPVLAMVAEIMACVAANNGQWHRYPCCLRLF